VIHVYAFVDELQRTRVCRGVDGAELEGVDLGGFAAVVSRHDGEPDVDERAGALVHGLVVEALRESSGALLPVRYGERFAGEPALREAVAARADRIRAALDGVRGCVELGVRVGAGASAPVRASSGRAYLEARLAETSNAAALAERLRPFARRTAASPGGETAYLVERERAEALRDAVRAFADAHPQLEVRCTGPWAPYSFGEAAA